METAAQLNRSFYDSECFTDIDSSESHFINQLCSQSAYVYIVEPSIASDDSPFSPNDNDNMISDDNSDSYDGRNDVLPQELNLGI